MCHCDLGIHHRNLWLIVVVAVSMMGCGNASLPPLPKVVPATWDRPLESAPGAPVSDPRAWWLTLNDPTLTSLVDRALTQNLSVAQAESRLRQARLQHGYDRRELLPFLSLSARPAQDVSARDTYYQVGLDANWELGLFGASESVDQRAAGRWEEAAGADEAVRISVIGDVVLQYIGLRSAERRTKLLDRQIALDLQALRIAETLEQERIGGAQAALDADVDLQQSRAARSVADQAITEGAQGLASLLGTTAPEPGWSKAAPMPLVGKLGFDRTPADLLRCRPEIRMAAAKVLEAGAELGLARADLYPHLTLGASLLFSYNLSQRDSISTTQLIPFIGPFIDIPLFDWGRRSLAVDVRAEALNGSLLAYRDAVIQAVAEAQNAMAALDRQAARVVAFRDVARDRRAQIARIRTRERLQLASSTERVVAERAALEADLDLIDANTAHTMAFVALYKAMGAAPVQVSRQPAATEEKTPA